jgi:hypothetical protein
MSVTKKCSRCHEELPVGLFRRNLIAKSKLDYWCRPCRAASHREWRNNHPEQFRKTQQRYYKRRIQRNPNFLREHYRKYYPARRNANYQKLYGITLTQYESWAEEQGGKCACCGETSKLFVDHCHHSGEIRGLICRGCNLAAGLLKNFPSRAIKLARYLSYLDYEDDVSRVFKYL